MFSEKLNKHRRHHNNSAQYFLLLNTQFFDMFAGHCPSLCSNIYRVLESCVYIGIVSSSSVTREIMVVNLGLTCDIQQTKQTHTDSSMLPRIITVNVHGKKNMIGWLDKGSCVLKGV